MALARAGLVRPRGWQPWLPWPGAPQLGAPLLGGQRRLSGPVEAVQASLLAAHAVAGGPWWSTIVGCTLAFRAALVPVTVLQLRTVGQVVAGPAAAHLGLLGRLYGREVRDPAKDRRRATSLYVQGVLSVLRRFRVSPVRLVAVPLTQLAVLVVYIGATRELLRSGSIDLSGQGALWFPDLGAKDATLVLPLVAVWSSYTSLELALGRMPPPVPAPGPAGPAGPAGNPKHELVPGISVSDVVREALQGLLVFSVPFICQLPSGVFMYWIPSSLFGVAQTYALRNTELRKALGLPIRVQAGGGPGRPPTPQELELAVLQKVQQQQLVPRRAPLVMEAARDSKPPRT